MNTQEIDDKGKKAFSALMLTFLGEKSSFSYEDMADAFNAGVKFGAQMMLEARKSSTGDIPE